MKDETNMTCITEADPNHVAKLYFLIWHNIIGCKSLKEMPIFKNLLG